MPDKIEHARSTSARFYRADLHLHSPLSHDWQNDARSGYEPDPLLNRIINQNDITEEKIKAYYNALKKSGLEIVAITDHMKWSFGVQLAEFAQKQPDSILVLPGIEISAKFAQPIIRDYRIHVLAIFPPNIGKTKIDKIFPDDFPDEYNRTGKTEEVAYSDINEIIERVRKLNGFTIAAHIYSNNGIRLAYTKKAQLILKSLGHGEREYFYKEIGDQIKDELYKFDCLQVTESTDPVHFKDADGEQAIPLICCSDAHHIGLFSSPSKNTFIKLGKLDFNCFSEAFKYPGTRIRFYSNLPKINPPRLRGMRIFGKKSDSRSFFKDLSIGFSDNLTCIVGPRGSGKSTIIDAIRYTMGYNRNLSEIDRVRQQVIDRQKNTLYSSRIELFYEKADEQIHKISSTYDERETYTTQMLDLNDTILNIPDVEASNEYPLNLYGWNELELLGEDPKSQREGLDRFIKTIPDFKRDRSELYASLEENATVCDRQLAKLDQIIDSQDRKISLLRLKEYESEFNKLNTPEMEATFQMVDSINRRLSFTWRLSNQIRGAIEDLEQFSNLSYESLSENQKQEKEWIKELLDERLGLKEYNDLATKYKSELEGKLKGYLAIIEQEGQTLETELKNVTKNIKVAVGEETSISADLRNNAKRRFDDAYELFDYYKQELLRFEKMLDERRSIIDDIQQINERIFATRNREISSIVTKMQVVEDENFKVELRLEQANDQSALLEVLQSNRIGLEYGGQQYKNRRFPQILSENLTPFKLSDAIFNTKLNELCHSVKIIEGESEQVYLIDQETANKILSANLPFEEIADLGTRHYIRNKMNVLFKIEQIPFDDNFFILLNGRPIQHCSPGQRCSAMLPIVTLTSDAPIIIDQPEDNLDNRLVSKAVFKILSKLKEVRQIILATHNPNILVSGDAEQVVVLKSDGSVDDYGSIDEPTIVSNIIDLMEGGKEAFERRQVKYGIQPRK